MHQLQDIKTKAKSSTLIGGGGVGARESLGGGAGECVGEGRYRRQHPALGARKPQFKPFLNSSPVAELWLLVDLFGAVGHTESRCLS